MLRGCTSFFAAVFETLVRVTLYLTDRTHVRVDLFGAAYFTTPSRVHFRKLKQHEGRRPQRNRVFRVSDPEPLQKMDPKNNMTILPYPWSIRHPFAIFFCFASLFLFVPGTGLK